MDEKGLRVCGVVTFGHRILIAGLFTSVSILIMSFLRHIVFLSIIICGTTNLAADLDPTSFDINGKNGVVDDVIDIHVLDREIIAVREGVAVHRELLGLREEVLWKGAQGHVGAVLTDRRLLAVSATIPGWRHQDLRIEEVSEDLGREILVSDFLVMAILPKRLLLFDGLANDWVKMNIPLHDPVEQVVLENFVAAIITEKQVYGIAARRGRFVKERLHINERILSITSRPHSISIRTNRRLLVFRSRSPFWDTLTLR